MTTFEIGTVLDGRYELLELLGEGGMGQVFKARHNRLGKIFAVKSLRLLSPDPKEQAKFLEAFVVEAQMLAELDHPALARVSDFFEMGDTHFLVMEFIDGKTLSRVVELAPRNLSQRRVQQWAAELCTVLKYLHTQAPPVIVRDLKPDNVLIDSRRRLRLIDFGISKRLRPGEGTRDIVKGMGTAEYAPLEQYGNSNTDQRSDIYALGATLYFLLTEIAPPPAWKRASEKAEPIPPSSVNGTVTPEFERLVLDMMALRREARPQSIQEVIERLERLPESTQKVQNAPRPQPPAPVVTPAGPVYESPAAGQRYGMPGASVPRARTVIRPAVQASSTGRIPSLRVVSCRSLRRYATAPRSVLFRPGTGHFVVAGRYLQLWDTATETVREKLWSGEQQLLSLDYTSDGRYLAAAEKEGEIQIYDLQESKQTSRLGRRTWGLFPDKVRDVCILYGRGKAVVASDSSNLRIFDIHTGEVTKVVDWHQSGLFSKLGRKSLSLDSSKTGMWVAGGADGSISVYEGADANLKVRKEFGKGEIETLELSSDGQFLVAGCSRGSALVLKFPSLELVHDLVHPSNPSAVSISPDLRLIATGAADCQIRIFHLNTGKELLKMSHHKGAILDLDFSPVAQELVSAGNDRRLYLTSLEW